MINLLGRYFENLMLLAVSVVIVLLAMYAAIGGDGAWGGRAGTGSRDYKSSNRTVTHERPYRQ